MVKVAVAMRRCLSLGALGLVFLCASPALAQERPEIDVPPEADGSLTGDLRAQMNLGGFRRFLERIEPEAPDLFRALDPPTRELEDRELTSDIVLGVGLGLGAASLIAAIPSYEAWGLDGALPFVIGGLAVAAVALFVATLIRPGRGDLIQLFDLYDQALGRR